METHLHFEGSIPPRALRSLARRHRASVALPRAGAPMQRGRGFDAFLEAFIACARLLRSRRDVEEAAAALFEDLRREGVAYAEVIFSPQSHLRRGLSLHDLVHGLHAARLAAEKGGGPRIAFIADGGRLWGPAWMEELVEQVALYRELGVVAVGLGGDERIFPARAFRRAFELARRRGLGCVAHAGEGTSPRQVREAVEELGVSRIGHGIAAADDPSLLKALARRGTLLEVCPTSNYWTGAVPSLAAHPLPRLLDAGVRVTLGSDDRTIFGSTLRREYAIAGRITGLRPDLPEGLLKAAANALFVSRNVKRSLISRITQSISS